MPNVPDNEMEHFFRESANENYDIEFNPAAWEKMEKKLDKEDKKFFWWRLGILLPFIFVGLVGLFFLITPFFHPDQDNNKEENISIEQQDKQHLLDEKSKNKLEENKTPIRDESINSNNTTDPSIKDATSEVDKKSTNNKDSKSDKESLADHSGNTSKPSKGDKVKPDNSAKEEDTGKFLSPDKGELSGKTKQGEFKETGKELGKDIMDTLNTEPSRIAKNREQMAKLLQSLPTFQTTMPSLIPPCEADCKLTLDTIALIPIDTASNNEQPTKEQERGLYANFTISPDLSGVGAFMNTDGVRSGVKSGLILEYQASSRLSFYSGTYFSKKRYGANPEDYHPPAGFWTNGMKPSDIDASCTVLEIPVGIRFKWLKRERNALTIGGGLSSYLLLREEYLYSYDQSYPNLVDKWVGKNKSKHWFGIGTVTVGYEKKIGNRSSFVFEPFFQVPLAGVGFGKVDLYSYGTYLTLKYRLK